MTDRCARCDGPAPDRKMYPPLEWVEYLRAERGLTPPEGALAVPLCGECKGRLAPLRNAFREFADLDADARVATRDRIRTELDALTLEALADETGPAPDDVRSAL